MKRQPYRIVSEQLVPLIAKDADGFPVVVGHYVSCWTVDTSTDWIIGSEKTASVRQASKRPGMQPEPSTGFPVPSGPRKPQNGPAGAGEAG